MRVDFLFFLSQLEMGRVYAFMVLGVGRMRCLLLAGKYGEGRCFLLALMIAFSLLIFSTNMKVFFSVYS